VSSSAKIYAGILLLTLVTVETGGHLLLSLLKGSMPEHKGSKNPLTYTLFRAGHAHAGVLVLVALVANVYVEYAVASEVLTWVVRISLFVAPLGVSLGMFAGGGSADEKKPGRVVNLVYVGAGALAVGLTALAVGLFTAS
jgi:hypothetical protein